MAEFHGTREENDAFRELAIKARTASYDLAQATSAQKAEALVAIADALLANIDVIIKENAKDVARAREQGSPESIIDRLSLSPERLSDISLAVRDVSLLPDPIGEVVREFTLPNGLAVRQVRVPLGIVGIIYEARPNVTVDAAVLALKSGNVALLRGSSSAKNSNRALVEIMQDALATTDIPRDSVGLVPGDTHESVNIMLKARGLVDVIIPRGSATLINSVVENSSVPIIETGAGNCHVYVDKDADIGMAMEILINAKTHRTSVCNATETVLVHSEIAPEFLPVMIDGLNQAGVAIHADDVVAAQAAAQSVDVDVATDDDWAKEYLSMDIAAGVVDSIDDAIAHIRRWSSNHSETIVTNSLSASEKFTREVDSAAVLVNASTRFTDGGEFGFGAEIGISTQKLHARGPMGLPELTSTKYVVLGDGHVRS